MNYTRTHIVKRKKTHWLSLNHLEVIVATICGVLVMGASYADEERRRCPFRRIDMRGAKERETKCIDGDFDESFVSARLMPWCASLGHPPLIFCPAAAPASIMTRDDQTIRHCELEATSLRKYSFRMTVQKSDRLLFCLISCIFAQLFYGLLLDRHEAA